MKWDTVKLGEVSNSIQTGPFGSQLHQSDYSANGIPVVMPKDIIDGHISETSIARVSAEQVERLSRHKIESGDILYSRRGDVGRCAYASDKEMGWLCGTGCLKVSVNPKMANSKFIFYQLQQPKTVSWIINHAVGATMLNLNTSILSALPLELPSLDIQMRSVDILSAYDDLIENNQKQIKLLEEAAQRLYKEWFVDFRFPGHETAKFINGLPEGWRKGTLSELGQFKRGKTITKEQTVSGSVPVVAGGLEPAYYHNQSNTESPVVTVSASGANAGFTRMYFKKIWASDCSFIDCKLTENLFFMYVFLKENPILLKNLQKGSAQPHVYPTHLNNLLLIIPAKDLLKKFCYVVTPIFSKLGTLDRQISILQEARDRLLNKVMNFEEK